MLLLLATGLGACRHDKGEGGESSGEQPDVSVSETIPTVATVSWTTEKPTFGSVEFGLDELDQSTPAETEATREHSVVVFGMKAGETYTLRAVSTSEDGSRTVMDDVELSLALPPADLPKLTVTEYDEAAAAPGGYILTSLIQPESSWVVIVDRDGDYVWYWHVIDNLGAPTARFDAATHSVYFLRVDILGKEDRGEIVHMSLDGTSSTTTRALMGHHDAVLHEDGSFGWLAFDFRDAMVDGSVHAVVGDNILEAPEGSTEDQDGKLIYSILDKTTVYAHCEHFYDEVFQTGAYDFSHANSLTYDKDRGVYHMLNRNLDTLLSIDRATGEVLHRVGGDSPEIATEDPADMWSHGHLSHTWDGGFMIFDNGFHRDPKESKLVEYALDEERGTLEKVWEWSDPDELFNPVFGDAQKLENTYMSSWTEFGRLQEISADGEIVWRAESEIGTAIGRAIWTDDLYDLSDVWSF